MKIQIVKNKYLNAVLILMLVSAIAHMAILFWIAIITANIHVLNYFDILNLGAGPSFDIPSFVFVLFLYGGILYFNEKH